MLYLLAYRCAGLFVRRRRKRNYGSHLVRGREVGLSLNGVRLVFE